MTITLGGITLSDHLVLSGLETAKDIVVNQRRSLTGESIIQSGPVSGGRTLTLSGDKHWTLAQIQAVKALAALGQTVTLVHDRGTFTVLIVTTPVEPVIEYVDPAATDYYSGDITMIEAET